MSQVKPTLFQTPSHNEPTMEKCKALENNPKATVHDLQKCLKFLMRTPVYYGGKSEDMPNPMEMDAILNKQKRLAQGAR